MKGGGGRGSEGRLIIEEFFAGISNEGLISSAAA